MNGDESESEIEIENAIEREETVVVEKVKCRVCEKRVSIYTLIWVEEVGPCCLGCAKREIERGRVRGVSVRDVEKMMKEESESAKSEKKGERKCRE